MNKIEIARLLAAALIVTGLASAHAQKNEPVTSLQNVTSGSNVVNVAEISQLLSTWQHRMRAEFGMSNEEVRAWTQRHLLELSKFSAEQLRMAQSASSLAEFELSMIKAPLLAGVSYSLFRASSPTDIAFIDTLDQEASGATGERAKLGNSADAELVFTPVNPCRIFDSRPSQGGTGKLLTAESRTFSIWRSSSYASQGGSASNCGVGNIPFAELKSVVVSVSTANQNGQGYLTLYQDGASNPAPYGVVNYYQPGYVQTAFAVISGDRTGNVQSRVYASIGTDVIIDVVGYFARPTATELECESWFNAVNIGANSGINILTSPVCSPGRSVTMTTCYSSNNNVGNYLQSTGGIDINSSSSSCEWYVGGASFTGRVQTKCCRVAGR